MRARLPGLVGTVIVALTTAPMLLMPPLEAQDSGAVRRAPASVRWRADYSHSKARFLFKRSGGGEAELAFTEWEAWVATTNDGWKDATFELTLQSKSVHALPGNRDSDADRR